MSQIETDQEIDLNQIFQKIKQSIKTSIFNGIKFFIQNWKIIVSLAVIGVVAGTILDKTQKKYEHQVIVTPNFGSSDYLYSKIELLDSKIKAKDTLFLKNVVGLKTSQKIQTISIEPVIDVYDFVSNKPANFELIKLMAEDGDIKRIIEENITSKNYTFQTISLVTSQKINEKDIIQPILKYLNASSHYSKVQKEMYNNVQIKMKQNDTIISQIDAVLDNFSKSSSATRGSSLMYYNENTQLNDIIKTKEALLVEQGMHKLELITYDKTIKETSIILNLVSKDFTSNNKKILFPPFLILLYIFLRFFYSFYNKQKKS